MAAETAAKPASELPREELYRRCLADAWPVQSRNERVLIVLGMLGLLASSYTDYLVLGASSARFPWLVALHVAAALAGLPLLLATLAPSPPASYGRAGLLFMGAVQLSVVVQWTLVPIPVPQQGLAMIVTWGTTLMAFHAPLRPKLLIGAGTFIAYAASLLIGAPRGEPHEIFVVLLSAVACVFGLPFVPHQMWQQRLRELATRLRLEREVALREERERALEVAKEAAERAEREAKEQKTRADAAAEEARREARSRSTLLANMSHDLRTPMAGILGLVDLMRGTPLDAEQAGYIETIRASNQTLLALLNDIVDFSRIEEGKLPITPAPVPLAETLRAPAELLRVTAERKGLALRVDLPEAVRRHVRLDPARVQQIVLNLLGNAIKFTRAGSVTLRADLRDHPGGGLLLRVEIEDTGIGFSAEQGRRLFVRFRQAEDSTSLKYGGSGLGLSICKGLAELMSGRIGADGEPNKGARFWFEIPTEPAEPAAAAPRAEVPALRVLLAEDNAVNQMILGRMLETLGQTVSFASDGHQALHLLSRQSFDLAILDVQMPGMDGDEVARRVRSLSGARSAICMVALTAGVAEQGNVIDAGFDAVYTKPIDMDGLRSMLVKEGSAALARNLARRAVQMS